MKALGFWAVVAVALVAATSSFLRCAPPPTPTPAPAKYLLRSFTLAEQRGIVPCCFDAFIATHQGKELAWKEARLAEGRRGYAYYNVLHVQPEAVDGTWWSDDAPWFTWLGQRMPEWGLFLIAEGDTLRFRYYGGQDYLINWAAIDSTRAQAMVDTMVALSPGRGLFWDQFWYAPAQWMTVGDVRDLPPETWQAWEANVACAHRIASRTFRDVLTNGDWVGAPGPVYIENGGQYLRPWAEGVARWRQDPERNVFSVRTDNPYDVVRAVALWDSLGGTLAFSPGADWAYEYADSVRRAR